MTGADDGWGAAAMIDLAARPERIWAVVSDFSRHPVLAGSGEVLRVRMNGPLAVGTTFESDVKTGEVGSFSPRCVIEEVNEPRRLAWVSFFPLEPGETADHQIEVHWSFEITPTSVGSRVRHTVRIPAPKAGADDLAAFFDRTDRMTTVRNGMQQTLMNVKAAAEEEAQTGG